jgi:hypothetical protein
MLKCSSGTSTGRTCDGYEATANNATQAPPVTQPLKVQADSLEIRSIEFFFERSRTQLAALFHDEWWHTQILQLAYTEISIRHALVALSMYHEQFTNRQAKIKVQFATRQQNLAIRKLLLSNQRSLTHLHPTTCYIFICIEVCLLKLGNFLFTNNYFQILQGNHGAAIRLFSYGYKMLQELQQQRARQSSAYESDIGASLRYLETSFNKLAIQVEMVIFENPIRLGESLICL